MDDEKLQYFVDRYSALTSDELLNLVGRKETLVGEAQHALDRILKDKGVDLRLVAHYSTPRSEIELTSHMKHQPYLIGGWLYLMAIGIVVSPILNAVHLHQLVTALQEADWGIIRKLGSIDFLQIVFGLVIQVFMLIFSIILAGLFFRRRASFPRTFIVYIVALFFLGAIGVLLVTYSPSATTESVSAASAFPIYVFILGAIWTSYLRRSERVKKTFVFSSKVSSHPEKTHGDSSGRRKLSWLSAADGGSRFARLSLLLAVTATILLGGGAALSAYKASGWHQLVIAYYQDLNTTISECEANRSSVSCELIQTHRRDFNESVKSRNSWSAWSERLGVSALVAPFLVALLYFGGRFVWTGYIRRRKSK